MNYSLYNARRYGPRLGPGCDREGKAGGTCGLRAAVARAGRTRGARSALAKARARCCRGGRGLAARKSKKRKHSSPISCSLEGERAGAGRLEASDAPVEPRTWQSRGVHLVRMRRM
ncbi:hypothetical protein MTO96_023638 [Rhipicephalus appendiculatus]